MSEQRFVMRQTLNTVLAEMSPEIHGCILRSGTRFIVVQRAE